MSAFPSDDNEKLLPGTVSDFLSHRRMTRCDWRVALAAVLSQCWHRLSEHCARTADDRRADGLVHFRVSWNGRTATHQCATFLAFGSRRDLHVRVARGRLSCEWREPPPRRLFCRLPGGFCARAGEALSPTQRFAAA